ncbi:hypothetical protein BT96DRAFT_163918 [Gymnopus androsaceus JB14]|uniref:Flavin reductase like domain-containing protein n=1 Tax=Gymnopus androsaceus JB14 TaxID=1447944 RepID=A0A6A4HBG2_9AGAR|nr:hypothetical protein BT96DRAFT_163918 [Gymnopus androsaceus JB14]
MLGRVGQRVRFSTAQNTQCHIKTKLRSLLRETAQPVAVVTSLLRQDSSNLTTFHGATLSSFSSIAMDPYPLVAFSLRIPSRMATSLRTSSNTNTKPPYASPSAPSDMVVNILSAAQASTAVLFSRPDLHPNPFKEIKYSLNDEGIPVLEGSLGALSCKLAAPPTMLDDLAFAGVDIEESRSEPNSISPSSGFTSELFIARVTKVEMLALDMDNVEPDDAHAMPLLYHRRGYSTCSESLDLGDEKI